MTTTAAASDTSVRLASAKRTCPGGAPLRGFAAPSGPARPRLRLTARGRRVAAALALLAALLAVGVVAAQPALASAVGQSAGQALSAEPETATVGAGQTLWDIAVAIADERDVRDVVADLQSLNDLDGGHIEPGQVLILPAES